MADCVVLVPVDATVVVDAAVTADIPATKAASATPWAAAPANELLTLQLVVAVHDREMADELTTTIGNQRLMSARVVYPVAQAVNAAIEQNAHMLFVARGTLLAPNALESAWWAMETRPELSFVAFGDERGARTPMLEAIANCVVLKNTCVVSTAGSSDGRWPGIAPLFCALEQGGRGTLIREPLITRSKAMMAADAPVLQAIAELRAKGLSDAVLGDNGHDEPPPAEPLQLLDDRAVPANEAPLHSTVHKRGSRHQVLALLQGFPMGGYAAFNADFLPRLVRAGHGLTVCTTESWRSEWRLDNVRAATPDIVHASGVVALQAMPRYISYLIESRNVDVVLVSHTMAGYRMLPWLRRRHPGTAFVDYVHTDWFEKNMYGSYATMGAGHAEWLDIQVASSETLARELVQRGTNPDTTCAVSINLDVKDWNPSRFPGQAVRKTLGCKTTQPLILFAGRLSSEKRPLLAVECWRALIASGVDTRFAVAGNGPLLSQMIEAVAAAGLQERVEFLGELDGDMLRFVYSAADVYHAPSEIEGIARSLFEAMAMECVPVVADVGGQHELVSAECGLLVPHGDDEVARYVVALTQAVSSVNMRRMARASRARIVEQFNSTLCVSAFEAVFDRAVTTRAVGIATGARTESMSAAQEMAIGGLETMRRHFWRSVRQIL